VLISDLQDRGATMKKKLPPACVSYFTHLRTALVILLLLVCPEIPQAQETNQEHAWPLPAPELPYGALTETEKYLIEQALASVNMTWDDMGYRKDYVDDPFRLTTVQRALDEPGYLVDWNYAWDDFLYHDPSSEDIILKATYTLDCDPELEPVDFPGHEEFQESNSDVSPFESPMLPETQAGMVRNQDYALHLFSEEFKRVVLGSLYPSDLVYLRENLPCDFSESNDIEGCPQDDDFEPPQELLDAMQHYDVNSLLAVSKMVAYQVVGLLDALERYPLETEIPEPIIFDGLSGKIVIGSTGDDVYYLDDYAPLSLLIDFGGNDVYYGSAAAGNIRDENNSLITVTIDMSGDDIYLSDGRRSIGSGVLGISHHVDVSGNDVYRCGDFSLGAGVFGVGILEDRGGSDLYDAGELVEGAAACGLGLLIDSSGNDSYRAAVYAQGMGFTRGFGLLTDRDGFDTYWAGGHARDYPRYPTGNLSLSQGFAMGMRASASGGVGILNDRNGNDFYDAEVYGQGSSYWYGIGALIDDNGNDWYQCHQYCQGAGIHLSAGILLDRGGIDRYDAYACTQGYGHDLAVGWLIDEWGDDYYTGLGTSQGTASANGVGILIDRGSGNDGHFAKDPPQCLGYGGSLRGYGGIGIFIDEGGPDIYTGDYASDGGWWTKGTWGIGMDVGDDWWDIVTDENGVEISRTLRIPGGSE
jgi:hypothetical protein